MILTVILIITVSLIFYKFWVRNYKYWDQAGVPNIPGKFPFGSDFNFTFLRKFQGHMMEQMGRKFPNDPLYGLYIMRRPVLIIKDPEYVQFILVKEFSSFKDRLLLKIPEHDMLSQHLINLDGERWRALRNKLSPTFTSGRIKAMFPLIKKCSEDFQKLLSTHENKIIDVKELASRYTTDTICSCAFGLESNVMTDDKSDLIKIGKNILSVNLELLLGFFIITTFPKFAEYISLRFTPEKKESQRYVYHLVKETIAQREEKNIKRNDFLNLLIELKNKGTIEGEKREETEDIAPFEMTLERLAAQCFVFFVAGYETSSSVHAFCLYELALHPEIQEKVQIEIDEMTQLHAGVTYEAIKEMAYLEMVVAETMRKYPTIPAMSRLCTKTVTMPNGVTIEKGQMIFVPIWPLHYDPLYFPEPEKFDPERFSPDNKDSIHPFAYLPFGEGPRFCIGKRFAMLQTKIGLITILRNYSVEPCESTVVPLEFDMAPLTTPKQPLKLKLVKRKLQ